LNEMLGIMGATLEQCHCLDHADQLRPNDGSEA